MNSDTTPTVNWMNPVTGTVHTSRQCARRMAYGNVHTTTDAATCGICTRKAAPAPRAVRPACTVCGDPTSHKSGVCSDCRALREIGAI